MLRVCKYQQLVFKTLRPRLKMAESGNCSDLTSQKDVGAYAIGDVGGFIFFVCGVVEGG